MKIAILSRWNSACGVSLLAELIGREFAKRHKLVVFAPTVIRRVREDEDYVIRCYSDVEHERRFFDPEPFIENDYDVFIAQRIEWTPVEELLEIFPEIRRKAKTVYVVHERKPPTNELFYKFEWDAVVCFDERYVKQWEKTKYKDKLRVIPYPTGPLVKGDKEKSRKKLGIDEGKILLSYGWKPELHVLPAFPALKDLSRVIDYKFLLLVDPESKFELRDEFVEIRRERPPLERIYEYLHASDVCLIHKEKGEVKEGEVVVSSSVLMCLGALTPIVTSDTEFVTFLSKEVIKYKDLRELKLILKGIFEGTMDVTENILAAENYVKQNCPEKIAKMYLELFKEL